MRLISDPPDLECLTVIGCLFMSVGLIYLPERTDLQQNKLQTGLDFITMTSEVMVWGSDYYYYYLMLRTM